LLPGKYEYGDGRFKVAFRRDRESGFNDIHLEPLELPGELHFLFNIHAEAGGLLTVS
jgi:hypothetical protein